MNNNIEDIVTFLKSIDLFRRYDAVILENIASALKTIFIQSGEILMHQGDVADSFYIVMHGRLRAFIPQSIEHQVILGEIGPGQIVGEVALLTDAVRIATVQAIRDSVLLKFDQKTFNSLLLQYPEVIMNIAKASIKRLIKKTPPENTVITITVLPAGEKGHISDFTNDLVKTLEKIAPTQHLNFTKLKEKFGEDLPHSAILSWLNQLEKHYRYIVYEADVTLTDWTYRCIRQADRILMVGYDDQSPQLNEIEKEFFQEKYAKHHLLTEFALVHRDAHHSRKMTAWLELRPLRNYYNIQSHRNSDFQRLVRFLTGRAQAVVLSGGGARALCHLGVLKAMQELGIEIDMIGGASMGAWLAALYTKRRNVNEIIEITKDWVNRYKGGQYTLPIVSIFKDIKLEQMLKEGLGADTMIEHLRVRYFCVSTNLSQSLLTVHDRGSLWHAVRASLSIPGVFPPVFTKNNDLLIDGGIMNNLPVDIMRKYIDGGTIIAVSIVPGGKHIEYQPQSLSSGWKVLLSHLHPARRHLTYPTLGRIVFKATTISSRIHEEIMQKEANFWLELDMNRFGLLDFKSFQEIVDEAYELAKIKLTQEPYTKIRKEIDKN